MAVAFDAVGPSAAGAGASGAPAASPLTWSHNPAAGAALLVGVCLDFAFNGTVTVSSVTFGGVTMTSLGSVNVNSLGSGGMFLYGLTNVTGGSQTVSVSFTSGSGNPDVICGGSISFTGAGSFGTFQSTSAGTGTETKVFSTTSSSSLLGGFCGTGGGTAMTTSAGTQRFTNNQGGGNGSVGNTAGSTAPGTGGNVTMTWAGNTTATFGIVGVEVLPSVPAPPTPVVPLPLLPPGWFPGAEWVTTSPGSVPFAPEPGTTDATPAVIIPATPEPAPIVPVPPGWFPGADRVTAIPDGIPFQQAPPPITATPAVIFPVPEVAGEPDWLPLPPGWFPGAALVTTDPGSIPFYSLPQPQTPPPAPPPVPTITGLAGTGAGYFTDQNGNPRMWVGDEIWALITNAGRWNSGNSRATFDSYFATRAKQGYTICYSDMFGSTFIGGVGNGQMWDGTTPFTGGDPSAGLNETYWSRIDYAFTAAAANGITIALSFGGHWDWDVSGNSMFGLTATQYQDAGNKIGNRYKGRQNLIWLIMDDYFGSFDSSLSSLLTGLRNSGDTHPIAIENYAETSSRFDLSNSTSLTWGASNTQYNFGYSYSCTYLCIEYMYAEASPLTCIYGDGYFYQGGSTYAGGSGAGALDRAARQDAWWAVTSGARGFDLGDEALWQWPSTAPAAVSTQWYAANNIGNIRKLMESLPGWQTLAPATGSTLITAGRGTRATQLASGGGGGQYEPATSNSYVSASITPDGSLAVMYLPNATTITIDQSKLGAGYLAYWADPITGVKTLTTSGPTYNSTAQGNNSQGDPDWVLVLQGPAVVPASAGLPDWLPLPPGWFPGADGVTVEPGGIPFWVQPQPTDQNAAVAGAVTASAGLATGTGAALGPVPQVTVFPAVATGTGAALSPVAAVQPNAVLATGTGAALSPVIEIDATSVTVATGTGAALSPVPVVTVLAGLATGTGAALNPSVSTSGTTTANAQLATGTGAALPPVIEIDATSTTTATGAGAALSPVAGITVFPTVATGTGAALSPVAQVIVFPAVATGTGAALNPTVNTSGTINAQLATGTGAALGPVVSITAFAVLATATGAALNPGPARIPALSSGTGAAFSPQVSVIAFASTATGTGAALQPVVLATAAVVKGYSTGTSVGEAAGMQASVGEAASDQAAVSSAASSTGSVQ